MTEDTKVMTTALPSGLIRVEDAWSCERCTKIFIGQHFSAEHCNWTGTDLVLCEDCAEFADDEYSRRYEYEYEDCSDAEHDAQVEAWVAELPPISMDSPPDSRTM